MVIKQTWAPVKRLKQLRQAPPVKRLKQLSASSFTSIKATDKRPSFVSGVVTFSTFAEAAFQKLDRSKQASRFPAVIIMYLMCCRFYSTCKWNIKTHVPKLNKIYILTRQANIRQSCNVLRGSSHAFPNAGRASATGAPPQISLKELIALHNRLAVGYRARSAPPWESSATALEASLWTSITPAVLCSSKFFLEKELGLWDIFLQNALSFHFRHLLTVKFIQPDLILLYVNQVFAIVRSKLFSLF